MTATSRRTMAGAALLLGVLLAGQTQAQDVLQRARADLRVTLDEVLADLGNQELDTNAKLDELLELAERRFDLPRMSKLVLGRARRKLSEEQQAEFQKEVTRHITLTYGDAIEAFTDEAVELGNARLESNGDVTIKTVVVGGSADGTHISYRVRERDGVYVVVDLIPEGVSLVQNFRAQINEIVREKGAEALIETLRQKNAKDEAARAAAS